MAKYVELIGVSGVGKSTTYNFLSTSADKRIDWILYEDLYRNNNARNQSFKSIVKQYVGRIIRLNGTSFDMNALDKYFRSNPDLMELFWHRISKNENTYAKDLRFYGVKYIMAILEKIQNIKDEKLNKYCILDEGLVHNINYFIPPTPNLEQISDLLDIMDLPNAVVYFDGDIDTIIDRSLARGLRPRDEDLSLQELRNSRMEALREKETCLKAISLKNIPVLKLEATDSAAAKSKKIKSFIHTLP